MPLITFEGIDGTGKSTTIANVAAALRAQGHIVHATREETEGPTGEAVRRSIREHWDPLATTFLFVADRANHLADLRPRLEAGDVVLCDRFVHSTYAYQSVTLQGKVSDPMAFLRRLHDGWCPMPDHVILLTCDPATAVQRTEKRGSTTPYEKVEFLTRVQARYLDMAKTDPQRFTVIDTARPKDEVSADALGAVQRALAKK